MAKYVIKFENVDFDFASGVYGATIAGELGCFEVATGSDADFENGTMSYSDLEYNKFCEIFPSLIIGMIENGCNDFVIKGCYDTETQFFAQYKNDILSVSKSNGTEKKEAEYQLEDGLFDDNDGDEFSCFFD